MSWLRADVTRNGIVLTDDLSNSEILDLDYPVVQFYLRFQDYVLQNQGRELTFDASTTFYQITATDHL